MSLEGEEEKPIQQPPQPPSQPQPQPPPTKPTPIIIVPPTPHQSELSLLSKTSNNEAPFPPLSLSLLATLPGNTKCMDCTSPDTTWASVTYGILLCLNCSGRHRSLGVNVSFVRSLTMDNWNCKQILMMLEGGNGQLKGFFERQKMNNVTTKERSSKNGNNIDVLYRNKAAKFYREKLDSHVKGIILKCGDEGVGGYAGRARETDEGAATKSRSSGSRKEIHHVSHASPSFKSKSKSKSPLQAPLPSPVTSPSLSSTSTSTSETYTATFHTPHLGLSLSKHPSSTPPHTSSTIITRVTPYSSAADEGVLQNDVIVAVNGVDVREYEGVMECIKGSGRPLILGIVRVTESASDGDLKLMKANMNTNTGGERKGRSVSNLDLSGLKGNGLDDFVAELTPKKVEVDGNEDVTDNNDNNDKSSNDTNSDSISTTLTHTLTPPRPPQPTKVKIIPPSTLSDPKRDYTITFNPGPLGLSLERRVDGSAVVTKCPLGGQAHGSGVSLGSIVIGLNGNDLGAVSKYDELMRMLRTCASEVGGGRPVALSMAFRRPMEGMGKNSGGAGGGLYHNAMGEANVSGVISTYHPSPSPSSKKEATPSSSYNDNQSLYTLSSTLDTSSSSSSSSSSSNINAKDAASPSSRKAPSSKLKQLGLDGPSIAGNSGVSYKARFDNGNGDGRKSDHSRFTISDGDGDGDSDGDVDLNRLSTSDSNLDNFNNDYYDVTFKQGSLGLTLDETCVTPTTFVSTVSKITAGSAADTLGVNVGDVVCGVNGRDFISHGHTITTVKFRRDGVVLRMRRMGKG